MPKGEDWDLDALVGNLDALEDTDFATPVEPIDMDELDKQHTELLEIAYRYAKGEVSYEFVREFFERKATLPYTREVKWVDALIETIERNRGIDGYLLETAIRDHLRQVTNILFAVDINKGDNERAKNNYTNELMDLYLLLHKWASTKPNLKETRTKAFSEKASGLRKSLLD